MPMNDELMERLLWDGESSCLDYKKEQYPFATGNDIQKSELLKDILAFANRWRGDVAHILIGVEEAPGGRAIVHGITEHIPDHELQQFVNGKTNRTVAFSYEAYAFEGKQVGVIEISEQERPIYLRNKYGKLEKGAVHYRQGSSTAVATPDEIIKMGAPVGDLKHVAANNKEQVRVKLGLGIPGGLYADVFNSGQVPVYVKRVAIVAGSRDETKDPPSQEMSRSIPLLTTLDLPVADGQGSSVHVALGPQKADIDPRREVRFVLQRYPSEFLETFTTLPEAVWLSVETFGGEIHQVPGANVVPLLVEFIKYIKLQEAAEKPTIVSFYTGDGYLIREGTVTIQGKDGRREVTIESIVDGFKLSDDEQTELIRDLIADRVCGRVGKYQWRLGE
jgi:hypothetical protein